MDGRRGVDDGVPLLPLSARRLKSSLTSLPSPTPPFLTHTPTHTTTAPYDDVRTPFLPLHEAPHTAAEEVARRQPDPRPNHGQSAHPGREWGKWLAECVVRMVVCVVRVTAMRRRRRRRKGREGMLNAMPVMLASLPFPPFPFPPFLIPSSLPPSLPPPLPPALPPSLPP